MTIPQGTFSMNNLFHFLFLNSVNFWVTILREILHFAISSRLLRKSLYVGRNCAFELHKNCIQGNTARSYVLSERQDIRTPYWRAYMQKIMHKPPVFLLFNMRHEYICFVLRKRISAYRTQVLCWNIMHATVCTFYRGNALQFYFRIYAPTFSPL
jgi:hypothetical protein